MKQKKWIALAMASFCLTGSLSGCGEEEASVEEQEVIAEVTTEVTTATATTTANTTTEATTKASTTTTEETEVSTETEIVTETELTTTEEIVTETETEAVTEDPRAGISSAWLGDVFVWPNASFSSSDLAYTTPNGCTFALGQNCYGTAEATGLAFTSEQVVGCMNGSENGINYYFDGVTVNCYIDASGAYIPYQIQITSSAAATQKGITVGSSLADVQAAYGTGYTVYGEYYDYEVSSTTYLEFLISGDVVQSILYYAG